MSQKPHDIFDVRPLPQPSRRATCLGVDAFDRKYGTDRRALAAEFARHSPYVEMRTALKLVQAPDLADT